MLFIAKHGVIAATRLRPRIMGQYSAGNRCQAYCDINYHIVGYNRGSAGCEKLRSRLDRAEGRWPTLTDISRMLGITIHTAHNQLKSAMKKAQVHNQTELIGCLHRWLG